MAVTLKQVEAIPAAYPDAPSGLTTAAAAVDADMIWQRIEAYIAHRWASRAVVWTVEGCGDWEPPLTPATIDTLEVWQGDQWVAADTLVSPSPLGGYCLPGGTYRFTGTVGAGDPPAAVMEAFRRLAEYMASKPGKAGARSESITSGTLSLSTTRSPEWMGRAMSNSGAGDLLRPYRRA